MKKVIGGYENGGEGCRFTCTCPNSDVGFSVLSGCEGDVLGVKLNAAALAACGVETEFVDCIQL